MMEPTQVRKGEDLAAFGMWWHWLSWWLWNLLFDPLMRSSSVEGVHICAQHPVKLLLMEDEQMIEALTSYTSQEPFTDGIRSRCVIRGFENLAEEEIHDGEKVAGPDLLSMCV